MNAPFLRRGGTPVRSAFDLDLEAKMIAAAHRSVRQACKMRARRFIANPALLATIIPGLDRFDRPDGLPDGVFLVECARVLIERERQVARRLIGFGGEVPMINTRAVMLYARALRRIQRRPVVSEAV